MNEYEKLTCHPQSCLTVFDDQHKYFVHNYTKICRGLTSVLARAFPVTYHDAETCKRCASKVVSVASKLAVFKRKKLCMPSNARNGGISKSKMKRGHFVPIKSEVPNKMQQMRKICYNKESDRVHGIGVDEDVTRYVNAGNSFANVVPDECSSVLMAYLRYVLKWVPVATQVPLYSPGLRVATAIDLLCVDAETRSKLYIVEVKSTRNHSKLVKECYCAPCGHCTGSLSDLPLSRYSQHQLQLWAMCYGLREAGVKISGAFVLRTSPVRVTAYPLNIEWFATKESFLVNRMTKFIKVFSGKKCSI